MGVVSGCEVINKTRGYEEHHFQNVEDVGVAFDGQRIWVCLNGAALLRAKCFPEGLSVEYRNPTQEVGGTRAEQGKAAAGGEA